MRFHYDESAYNPHWGGDNAEKLLYAENPIVEHQNDIFRQRSKDRSFTLLEDLFGDEPYPPPDQGISIYAGFDEGVRLLHHAIHHGSSSLLAAMRRDLLTRNYFTIEPAVRRLVDQAGGRIDSHIGESSAFYRTRIGAHLYLGTFDSSEPLAYKPYCGNELGAPPASTASAGRLNRGGVSFLYLASDRETAAAEVRPHPSHILSIGEFRPKRPLRVAAFDAKLVEFATNESDLSLFDFLYSADKQMSLPVLPEDRDRYLITQLIADVIRQAGFDGVKFRSSVGPGHNLCVFDPTSMEYVEGSSQVVEVEALNYSLAPAPAIPAGEEDSYYSPDT